MVISTTAPAGTGVAIVAPGGYAPDEAALGRAIERLQAQGCLVHNYYDPQQKHERFGATDEGRLRQIHAAAVDPEVQIVLALRGGYGMSRILPALDFRMLAASGKLFVGHSDFTALQMGLLAQQGAISFAGPMVCDDFTREEASVYTLQQFWQCVSQPSYEIGFHADDNPPLDVSGILWGGNLTMLTHLVGTPYMPRIEGGILFVEDVNEHPYRVERMLQQLLHAGLLGQKALVLGDFSNYRLSTYDNGYDFGAMLAYLRAQLPMPVLTGLPFGHIRDKATLVVGSQARLQSDGRNAILSMSGYPALRHAR
ncbi:muramoyltetrapeptide carboxypeptidase [Noviherbaspirillum autotrophicum]|uniref:Peptidase S66 n=1 Tax=Noviherbaspirillum autotrophicum TaxID=709839 RepID=A0A0C1YPQ1_9BURK|nr:muramoyltetrapeptide carboxypeptidase [Noviherbaspirillum autotrophicum]KIF82557.1 peptidase S66 [Noviherbaspirillum autotrophicum]